LEDSVKNRNPLVTNADDETQRQRHNVQDQINNHNQQELQRPTIVSEPPSEDEDDDDNNLDVQSEYMSRLEDLDP